LGKVLSFLSMTGKEKKMQLGMIGIGRMGGGDTVSE
jgi:hypothetical protein